MRIKRFYHNLRPVYRTCGEPAEPLTLYRICAILLLGQKSNLASRTLRFAKFAGNQSHRSDFFEKRENAASFDPLSWDRNSDHDLPSNLHLECVFVPRKEEKRRHRRRQARGSLESGFDRAGEDLLPRQTAHRVRGGTSRPGGRGERLAQAKQPDRDPRSPAGPRRRFAPQPRDLLQGEGHQFQVTSPRRHKRDRRFFYS